LYYAGGFITVRKDISGITAENTLIVHKNIPLSSSSAQLVKDKTAVYMGIYRQYLKSAGRLDYSINLTKPHYDNFFLKDSVFFIAENYLAVEKSTFNSKKKIVLNISFPPGIRLIYPTKEDLEQAFYTAIPIIVGNFKDES
jgi:hypothetical protein